MQRIEDVILFQIDWTSKVSKQYSQSEFDRLCLGITVEQWIILKIVSESTAVSQRELANKSHRDPASITRTLDILEKKGLLIREAIPDNRRAYNIGLTKKGEKFIKNNMELINIHRANSIKGLSKEEIGTLSEILGKIRKNMS
ncbi:MarR family winged helix-turn-helix transcriptional regulator [Croceitalea marina]|uniref:MarR family winged helix-turn-helix transcriptional regulator n=1 Tax=Croceitalea marina TaxID=1775166 RepID=A0ABW5MUE5_9FLAO